jgi:hypothetical protein
MNIRIAISFLAITFLSNANAQTGIGTTTPHASAKLEISSNNKGFLPPRIALTGTNDITTIASPATGLVIYNTATSGTTPNNVIPGFYYYDASKWNQLVDQSSLNSFSGFNPNYAQSNASAVTKNSIGDIIVSQSITTSGRPVQIIATGDANPANNSAWVQLQLYRDGTAIGKKVQAESSSSNENVPYCLNFIDNPTTPGTYTYSVRYVGGSGSFGFGESDGNHITLLELGAWSAGTMPVSKGGTGNSSYTSGSVIFSDGTNLAQNNTNFFWDNTNGRLGIGTNAPTSKLNIAGGGVRIASGLGNSSTRPSVNTGTVGNYEIRGVGGGATQVDAQDDGFLRLSAGGGTNAIQQTSIDLSGYSATVPDMNSNIVMRTSGVERLRIDASGSVNVTGKINLTDPTGNVSNKAAAFVDAGTFVTLDNLKATVTTSAPRGLSLATVTGTLNLYVQGVYTNQSGTAYTSYTNTTEAYTTTASGSPFGWNFEGAGNTIIYHLTDATNSRLYRVTLIIMPSYLKNFISIERLI